MKKSFLNGILILLVMAMSQSVRAQIDRVEPPNWWAGMKNPALQLMVHGKNISSCRVEISYPGVTKQSVNTTDNPNYLFIDLLIGPETRPGTMEIRFVKEGATPLVHPYELLAREEGSSSRQGFTSADVIYLLMPDRFANGDPANDTVKGMREGVNRRDPNGRHGGDMKGIIDHMDYFPRMGFTALWINPLLENDQKRTSYHGYAITDFYRVDPRFGNNEDYRLLARRAREQGIKLIMDFVFNHCGSEHWWMSDMPARDWINEYPDYRITNHRRTVNMDPHASQYDLILMRDGWFVPTMPDLNQNNPFMATYLIQNSIWWVEYLGLQGIRMDTYPYPDKHFMARWCKELLDEYPYFTMVGEEWSENPAIVSYWQRGKINQDGYQGGLPSLMDFPLQAALSKALTEKEDWAGGWVKLYETVASDYLYPEPDNLVMIGDNHDMPRLFMQLGMDTSLYKLGIAFLLTTRGIPQIYYGSEILMTHTEGDDHAYIRKDFPGGWQGDAVNAFTGKGLTKKEKEMQSFFSSLLNWRKNNPVIHSGRLIHFAPVQGMYVYFRIKDNDRVMVILNKNRKKTSLALDRFQEGIGECSQAKDVLTDQVFSLKDSLLVPGRTALILELK